MDDLDGRVAVVTGAASGLGFAISKGLAAAGVKVLMTDVDADGAAGAAEEVRSHGGVVEGAGVDVRDPEALDRIAAHAVDHFGALHIAVNNAGIVNGGPMWELPLEEWRRVLDVNLWGVIHGVRVRAAYHRGRCRSCREHLVDGRVRCVRGVSVRTPSRSTEFSGCPRC